MFSPTTAATAPLGPTFEPRTDRADAYREARERDLSVFIESFAPPPRMIIFGAVDFTAALALEPGNLTALNGRGNALAAAVKLLNSAAFENVSRYGSCKSWG